MKQQIPHSNDIIRNIEKHVSKTRADIHQGLNLWMDYMIDLFDYSSFLVQDGFYHKVEKKAKESPSLMEATIIWTTLTAENMEKGKCEDILGTVYEELFLTRSKASSTGQFLTPMSISTLCAQIIGTEKGIVNDCACGSGRMLLTHYMQNHETGANLYYQGEDIDIASVKMCALNMMIHGMRGRAIRHDTLTKPDKDGQYSLF